MKDRPTVGGVCTGVGGFDLAFRRAGFRILWGCEIEKHCRSVLKVRFPLLHVYEDMMSDDILSAERPDIFVGGTPCQGFSLAGLRKGLNDDRSNLALRFLQLADHFGSDVIVWENVQGVLSLEDNAFGCFLAGLVGADAPLVPTPECGGRWTNAGMVAGPKRTAAWRVLDSQYFGVAQRRERVFVVASARAECPFQVLFEPEGVRRHSPPSREAGKRVAPTIEGRAGRSGCNNFATSGGLVEVAGTLGGSSQSGGFRTTDLDSTGAFIPVISPTLRAGGNQTGGDRPPGTDVDTCESLIPILPEVAWALQERDSKGCDSKGCDSSTKDGHLIAFEYKKDGADHGDVSPTLRATEHDKSHANGGGHVAVAFNLHSKNSCAMKGSGSSLAAVETPIARALDQGGSVANQGGTIAVAFTERTRPDGRTLECQTEVAYALTNPGSGGRTHSRQIAHGYAVRRLTPRECERLQAFPDDFTLVPNGKSKPMADGLRYKAMGNAVTTTVVEWIARRIYSLSSAARRSISDATDSNSSALPMPSARVASPLP